ncbi:alpha/beta fold hydrolase [Pseudonocardia dioxanivorans]|uniref:alpha/beta fold hydrolase n=1 Tax=Pseudonocardia dioxanivorans TaxID=240495 RepID=UPI000CD23CCD|nr:alpha/beta fold hydrolase [Pseudonocardia dioxanivorans]
MVSPDIDVVDGRAAVGALELCFQTRGSRADPALLLIMGFGAQLTAWDESFVDAFVRRGFFVIRYDHRDVGLSSGVVGVPDLEACNRGDHSSVPYTLFDMAADAAGLLDALDVRAAHVLGASMGGMIAQALAIDHPGRTLSLASVMSTTGDPGLPAASAEAAAAAVRARAARTRAESIEATVDAARVYAGSRFPFDAESVRRRAAEALDRADRPEGRLRHVAAVRTASNRTAALGRVRVPTVVVHGTEDPLLPIECGRATAAAIPGARFVPVPGLGHELPDGVQQWIVELVVANATGGGRDPDCKWGTTPFSV